MLDMVVDLKNNKKTTPHANANGERGGSGGEDDQWGFPTAMSKWLRSSAAVGDAAVALRALAYDRLQNADERKGQWWLPEAAGTDAWFAARRDRGGGAGDAARAASRSEARSLSRRSPRDRVGAARVDPLPDFSSLPARLSARRVPRFQSRRARLDASRLRF
jgi:nucleolar MIF4G domain-containing protein 1